MTEFRKILPGGNITGFNKGFIVTTAGLQALRGQVIDIPEYPEDEIKGGTSMLNTPVIDNLVFQAGSYIPLGQTDPVPYDELRIDAVIIEVIQNKNIVKTSIQGRNTTVKEYISDGDFKINIRGIIQSRDVNEQRKYPLALMKNFYKILKAQRSLVISSTFLVEVFGITDIVIESYNVPQVEGLRNQQPFSINAVSDVAISLEELTI